VSTPANQLLDHAQKFIRSKNSNQPVFMREVSLEPGERYKHHGEPERVVEFRGSGLYTVQGLFSPELSTGSSPLCAPTRFP